LKKKGANTVQKTKNDVQRIHRKKKKKRMIFLQRGNLTDKAQKNECTQNAHNTQKAKKQRLHFWGS
jgi:hypothetical protein